MGEHKTDELQKREERKKLEEHQSSLVDKGPQAGAIVHRDKEDIDHDRRVRQQMPGQLEGTPSKQVGRHEGAQGSQGYAPGYPPSESKQSGSTGDNFVLEMPGLAPISGSALESFEAGDLNQPIKDFVVVTSADDVMEKWWRDTQLYKDEPTASSYKRDVTLKTLDADGKEQNSHLIKGVYPKRRTERESGLIEWTFKGDFIAVSSQTRKLDEHAQKLDPQRRPINTEDARLGARQPTSTLLR